MIPTKTPCWHRSAKRVAFALLSTLMLAGCAVSNLGDFGRENGGHEIVEGKRFGIRIGASREEVAATMAQKGFTSDVSRDCTPANDQCKGETDFARYWLRSGLKTGTVSVYFRDNRAHRITWYSYWDEIG